MLLDGDTKQITYFIKEVKPALDNISEKEADPASAESLEYIQTFNDPKNPNNNKYIRSDIYKAQQKTKK